MIEQFQHIASNSFLLWFDNYLLKKGQAYSNRTGKFYYYEDERIDSVFKAFGSPYKQWVNDSSIAGATVPSGVWVNGSFKSRNDGVTLDFDNGRALISGNTATKTSTITGSFAVKDFNVYFTNETEDNLIIEQKFSSNPRFYSAAENRIEPYDYAVPAIFVSSESVKNEAFAFGGEDTTRIQMKAVVFAENSYQLDGVLSIFADSQNEVIVNIPFSGHPQTEFGDIKNGYYSYEELKSQYRDSRQIFFLEDVVASKLNDKAAKTVTNDLHVGFIDFELSQQRYPRS
jgi:hypothetical protein